MKAGNNLYSLFFITTQWLALEKINNAKWKLDPICGMHYDSLHSSGSSQIDMFSNQTNSTDTGKLRQIILKYLEKNDLNNISLGKIIILSGYLAKHGKEVVLDLYSEGKIDYIDLITGEKPRGAYLACSYFKKPAKVKISLKNE